MPKEAATAAKMTYAQKVKADIDRSGDPAVLRTTCGSLAKRVINCTTRHAGEDPRSRHVPIARELGVDLHLEGPGLIKALY